MFFSLLVQKYIELLLSLEHQCRCGHWHHILKFYVKVFSVMGKVLSGKLQLYPGREQVLLVVKYLTWNKFLTG